MLEAGNHSYSGNLMLQSVPINDLPEVRDQFAKTQKELFSVSSMSQKRNSLLYLDEEKKKTFISESSQYSLLLIVH